MISYDEAHVFVAAVRLAAYRKKTAPSIEDVCDLLVVSVESGLTTSRILRKSGIVSLTEDPFSVKVDIADYLAIENLPREVDRKDVLNKEVAQFMAKKSQIDKKVEGIKADLEKKRQNIKNDLEEKFRKEMEKLKKQGS